MPKKELSYRHKKKGPIKIGPFLAEREGFEPPEALTSTVFKTAAIDHSAISPDDLYIIADMSLSFNECKGMTSFYSVQIFWRFF